MGTGITHEAIEVATAQELIALSGPLARTCYGNVVTYSPKVFVPLTKLCRDHCGYCTFSRDDSSRDRPFLSIDEVLEIAASGMEHSCCEALFTLGDKPELRYEKAHEWLKARGYRTTAEYLVHACREVVERTKLLPHVNAGVLTRDELAALREVSVSVGLMLEISSKRLMQKGMPHHRCPDKEPEARLQMLREAGQMHIPVTTGLLIGIGETREERLQTLRDIQQLHVEHGHIQEVIIQNFCPKDGTPMQRSPGASLDEQLWTIAAARLLLSPDISIQSPPNLRPHGLSELVEAGINDLGGISPVTMDHVNPEAAWPQIKSLRTELEQIGLTLSARLPVYPSFVEHRSKWIAKALQGRVLQSSDCGGLLREDNWLAGLSEEAPPELPRTRISVRPSGIESILADAESGVRLTQRQVETLFGAKGAEYSAVIAAADRLRQQHAGDTVRYVVNRNINYTNICAYRCGFCAFSKRTGGNKPTEGPYDLDVGEVVLRAKEAWDKGATEVCMQGGIHPSYDGNTYLKLLSAIKTALPQLHVHAFSPLEVLHGATTLGISTSEFLQALKQQGLGSLPGTAAEILCDDIRQVICPDKLSAGEWLRIVGEAHRAGLPTTATIMFGHVEHYSHWAKHILAIRDLQAETAGITEFVPLPFVHVNSPIYKRGQSRRGPTWRETVLMYSVARLALSPLISNIQTSWVKLGPKAAQLTLCAGANDFGGILMNESISRAAGAKWGQGITEAQIAQLLQDIGRIPEQRTTLYKRVLPAVRNGLSRIGVVAEGPLRRDCANMTEKV